MFGLIVENFITFKDIFWYNKDKMKLNYFVIPIFVFLVSLSGSSITQKGMDWYKTLNLPALAPPGSVIGIVWTIIFILTAISAILFWNQKPASKNFNTIWLLFFINGLLNVYWSFLFFGQQMLFEAVLEMILLNLINLALIFLLWPENKKAAMLLLPYFIWVCFATYLAFSIFQLNS